MQREPIPADDSWAQRARAPFAVHPREPRRPSLAFDPAHGAAPRQARERVVVRRIAGSPRPSRRAPRSPCRTGGSVGDEIELERDDFVRALELQESVPSVAVARGGPILDPDAQRLARGSREPERAARKRSRAMNLPLAVSVSCEVRHPNLLGSPMPSVRGACGGAERYRKNVSSKPKCRPSRRTDCPVKYHHSVR